MTDYLQIRTNEYKKFYPSQQAATIFTTTAFNDIRRYPVVNVFPKTTTTKILYFFTGSYFTLDGTTTGWSMNLLRNLSTTIVGDAASNRAQAQFSRLGAAGTINGTPYMDFGFGFVDAPSSTLPLSYSAQSRAHTATNDIQVGWYGTSYSGAVADQVTAQANGILPPKIVALEIDPSNGGSFKQIVTTSITAASSGTSSVTTWFDPSLSVTITPTSASSTLWIVGYVHAGIDDTAGTHVRYKLQRDGSDLLVGAAAGSKTLATGARIINTDAGLTTMPINLMVAAGSTSSTTIKVLIGSDETSSATTYINRSHTDTDSTAFARATSHLSIIEILPS